MAAAAGPARGSVSEHEVVAGGAFEVGVGGDAGDPAGRGGWFDHGGPGGFEKQRNVVVAGQVGADEERVDDVGGDVVVMEPAG
ncbi:MAG TPA: hypothetical protein VME46_13890, partial [Acidimicrobiales bacterium]|nr:hypothetical protein [Acidimicrobiales bacterium]